jgi:hypothetical protein
MLLALFKRVVDRQSATGFKLLKFHLCSHFADDIMKWGPPSAYNSSTGESNHKMLKRRSRKTQRQQHLIEEQTGVRYIEHLSLQQSLINCVDNGFQYSMADSGCNDQDDETRFSGYSYYLNQEGIFQVSKKAIHEKAVWFDPVLQDEIYELLSETVLPFVDSNRVDFMTIFKLEGLLFRGDPSYKKTAWQDWAYCDWGEASGLIPIQILIFVDLSSLQTEIDINGVMISNPGKYAIVHMIEQSLDTSFEDDEGNEVSYRAHEKSLLFYQASKWLDDITGRPRLALVSTDSIASPCVGIPCNPDELMTQHLYTFMKSRIMWPELLVQAMKDGLKEGKML